MIVIFIARRFDIFIMSSSVLKQTNKGTISEKEMESINTIKTMKLKIEVKIEAKIRTRTIIKLVSTPNNCKTQK